MDAGPRKMRKEMQFVEAEEAVGENDGVFGCFWLLISWKFGREQRQVDTIFLADGGIVIFYSSA